MGWLNGIFGKKKQQGPSDVHSVDRKIRAWFEAAARQQGWNIQGWQDDTLWFTLYEGRHFLNCGNFVSASVRQGRPVTEIDVHAYVEQMSRFLANQKERERLIDDFLRVKDLLRPRLLTPGITEPQPQLATATHVPGELMRTVAIDWGETSTYVTHDFLKKWNISFQECFCIGKQNLIKASSPQQFQPFQQEPSVLLCSPQDGIGSARALIVTDLFPHLSIDKGFLFSVPSNDVALVHIPGGKNSIAIPPVMLQIALQAFGLQPHPLNASVFWQHGDTIERFSLVATEEKGKPSINYIETETTPRFAEAMKSPD